MSKHLLYLSAWIRYQHFMPQMASFSRLSCSHEWKHHSFNIPISVLFFSSFFLCITICSYHLVVKHPLGWKCLIATWPSFSSLQHNPCTLTFHLGLCINSPLAFQLSSYSKYLPIPIYHTSCSQNDPSEIHSLHITSEKSFVFFYCLPKYILSSSSRFQGLMSTTLLF